MARSGHLSSLVLSLGLGACIEVPAPPGEGALLDIDGAVQAGLAIDGGAARPPTGEPYTGPDCDTTGTSSGAMGSGTGDGAGGMPHPGSGGQLGGGAGEGAGAADSSGGGAAARRPSTAGEIVITELMSNPEATRDDAGEWFELHNPSASEAFDLGGCSVEDGGAALRALGGPLVMAPGAFVAVARGDAAGFAPDWVMSFSLANTADVLALHCDGVVIDRVAYGAGFPLAAGASSALDPDAIDAVINDDPSAWCSAQQAYAIDRGTPGAPNAECDDADGGSD